MVELILEYISIFLALMLVLPIHEFAHALVAVKCGDITPKLSGRYTINPLAHFDLSGLLCFLVAGFGWTKPVPINPNNFKNYKAGCVLTSISGVIANYLLAFVAYPLFILIAMYMPSLGYFRYVFLNTLYYTINMSLAFFVFNLIPVYPLDGFRLLDAFNKKRGSVYRFLRDKGRIILLFFIVLGIFADIFNFEYLDVLGQFIRFIAGILEFPIAKFWGLIFYG